MSSSSSSGNSRCRSPRSGYVATASTTRRTVKRSWRMHGCPFIRLGSTVIRSKVIRLLCPKTLQNAIIPLTVFRFPLSTIRYPLFIAIHHSLFTVHCSLFVAIYDSRFTIYDCLPTTDHRLLTTDSRLLTTFLPCSLFLPQYILRWCSFA